MIAIADTGPGVPAPSATHRTRPLCIQAVKLRRTVRRGRGKRRREVVLLHDVSFSIRPGELVAIVGGSGAGKTTLLGTLAGVQPPSSGQVLFNGSDFHADPERHRECLGYVPQDDIVHKELTVERTLHYAARLRLPADTTPEQRAAAVREATMALGLEGQAHQRVGSLSGGQRKRVSIGAELLTHPGVFFLDEPTSGLDPATGRDMLRLLRRLADAGSTVVLTTHAPQDVELCDRVIFLARGGYLAFTGTPEEALAWFGVRSFHEIYDLLANEATPAQWAEQFAATHDVRSGRVHPLTGPDRTGPDEPYPPAHITPRRPVGAVRQWAVLTQRAYETLAHNPLTLAILVGSPILVIAMVAVLFRAGAFGDANPSPSAALMILFWVAFGAFFFGLTYGLLMICTEVPIFHRERLVNLRVVPYVLSKMALLIPVLVVVVLVMVGVLRLTHRLPADGMTVYAPLIATLLLDGIAAIALGLLASAAVTRPEQATLALPMLCYPQVLFSGAILPVPVMAGAGKVMSWTVTDTYAFNALGKSIDINSRFADSASPLGPSLLAQYGETFTGSVLPDWAIMGGATILFLALTCWVLSRKSPTLVR